MANKPIYWYTHRPGNTKYFLYYREFCFIFRNCQSNIKQSNRVGDGGGGCTDFLPWWIRIGGTLLQTIGHAHYLPTCSQVQVGQVFGLSVDLLAHLALFWLHCSGPAMTFLECLPLPTLSRFKICIPAKNFTLTLFCAIGKLIKIHTNVSFSSKLLCGYNFCVNILSICTKKCESFCLWNIYNVCFTLWHFIYFIGLVFGYSVTF